MHVFITSLEENKYMNCKNKKLQTTLTYVYLSLKDADDQCLKFSIKQKVLLLFLIKVLADFHTFTHGN